MNEGISRGRYAAYVIILIIAVIFLHFLWIRGMRFFLVPSGSMEPTLLPRDYIVTLNEPEYKHGDIVVVVDPSEPGEYFVKRIVALEGDRVAVYQGAMHLNDGYVSEPYTKEPMNYILDEYVVSEGEVFLLGDNRNHSEDSSIWKWNWDADDPRPGVRRTLSTDAIVGKVRYIYHPFGRAGAVSSYPLDAAPAP
jgi:signal peptidase I